MLSQPDYWILDLTKELILSWQRSARKNGCHAKICLSSKEIQPKVVAQSGFFFRLIPKAAFGSLSKETNAF
jgi:hypothetical protein